jgi:deoxyribodipyrimidine photo-lyase
MTDYAIHWFRRDLRLNDNQALHYASTHRQGRVVPVFIVDPTLVGTTRVGPNRLAFLAHRLRTLHAELQAHGSGLFIAYGDPRELLPALAHRFGATLITWERDTAPWGRQRDKEIAHRMQAHGIAGKTTQSLTIQSPDALKTGAGTPYTVFTPYFRSWLRTLELPEALPIPTLLRHPDQPFHPEWPAWPTPSIPLPDSSAVVAEHLLQQFTHTGVHDYGIARDMLAQSGTSRLSPYLRFGIMSIQQCARQAVQALPATISDTRSSAEVWLSELAWRDFYHQILYHFPHVRQGAFRPIYDGIPWPNNPAWFAAWCAGQTGYPIVDAAMQQLRQEGWMHNRARMIVSSFLTKDLLIDWRWGERFFMQHLIDGDTAANNGGWQWAAGTGTDAQPYFRIFHPVNQGEKFDPHGHYVKKYLPQLQHVPPKYIHQPWLLPAGEMRAARVVIGADYPAPIVDHATQRLAALALYKSVKNDMS